MSEKEIFEKIFNNYVKAIMTHEQMASYYDFLNLRGYKRMHEYRLFEEMAEMRSVCRYYTNHIGGLLKASNNRVELIPPSWYEHTRNDITPSIKRASVKDAMEKWVEWEKSTKEMLENCYKELCDNGKIASAKKVEELLCGVDKELKYAQRKKLTLDAIDYDLVMIEEVQDKKHSYYDEKMREIGVEIC